jgi:hypothetical protein
MKNATIVLLFAAIAVGQDSTPPANCMLNPTVNTNTANCTNAIQQQPQRPDTVQLYQQGYQVGQVIGSALANRRANRWIKKYCKIHPGEAWWYTSSTTGYLDGTCPS